MPDAARLHDPHMRVDAGARPLVTALAVDGRVVLVIWDSHGREMTRIVRADMAAINLAARLLAAVTEAHRQRDIEVIHDAI
ncbi:hypothetical protein P7L78_21900 [Tistrella bauzanensis]|uniref:hypothetical protein n=1 Tax=Tistrella TaxID=171436 RepID=UPI0031F6521F